MIRITVDKESELLWLQSVLSAGSLNISDQYTLKYLGVDLRQNINFKKSDAYEDDVKEKREEYNRRFKDSGLRKMDIERLLREELLEKENKYDSTKTT